MAKDFVFDRMNLQLFAENAEPADTTATESTESVAQAEPVKTFTQEEIDKMIQQRLDRARRDEAKRIEQARAEGRSEAEKLAKMTEDERKQHAEQEAAAKMKQRLDELDRREKDIAMRELKAQAIDTMATKGLPTELVDVMTFTDADSCNAQITALETVFRASVQKAVDAKLKQSGVVLRTGGAEKNPDDMSDDEWFAAHRKKG